SKAFLGIRLASVTRVWAVLVRSPAFFSRTIIVSIDFPESAELAVTNSAWICLPEKTLSPNVAVVSFICVTVTGSTVVVRLVLLRSEERRGGNEEGVW